MQIRLVHATTLPGQIEAFRRIYETIVLPVLEKTPGCVAAGLLQHTVQPEQMISITFWRSEQDSLAYEKTGTFQSLVEASRPTLAASTEWHVQLSDDLTLEYVPVPTDPVIQTGTVTAESSERPREPVAAPGFFVRLVSMKLKPDMADEFRRRYAEEVIPALQQTPGCRHAYLAMAGQSAHEALSVTVWNSREAAAVYETSGRFDTLLEHVQPALTGIAQWKMAVDRIPQIHAVTSDDVTVEGFQTVVARDFTQSPGHGKQ